METRKHMYLLMVTKRNIGRITQKTGLKRNKWEPYFMEYVLLYNFDFQKHVNKLKF